MSKFYRTNSWNPAIADCGKCRKHDTVQYRDIPTDDGFLDTQYKCRSCGFSFIVESAEPEDVVE